MGIYVAGIALGFSLIVAVGPQNVYLLKQGVKRTGVHAVVLTCMISDIVLFVGGTLAVDAVSSLAPWILDVIKWVGVAYLVWFALLTVRDAIRGGGGIEQEPQPATRPEEEVGLQPEPADVVPEAAQGPGGGVAVKTRTAAAPAKAKKASPVMVNWVRPALVALALTWINPGAFIDGLAMVGGIANQYAVEAEKWMFVAGTITASFIWFPAVGYGAAALSKPLSRPKVWRVLNTIIALVLFAIAGRLALS